LPQNSITENLDLRLYIR